MIGRNMLVAAALAAAAVAAVSGSDLCLVGEACYRRYAPYGTNYSMRYGKIPSDYKKDADCVGNRRLQMRPYPGDCYGHDFTEYSETAWWTLFAEIGGDLQYAFDFILYDPIVQSAEVNQFWYLLAYLQRLARLVTDPEDVLSVLGWRKAMASGRRTGSQRASRLASRVRADLSVLDSLIAQARVARRRRATPS